MGILRSSVPAQVMSFLSRQPFRLVPISPHSCSASALMISFAMLSASCLSSSCMLVVPSANLGISVDASATVSVSSATLSIGPSSFPRIRFVAISDSRTMTWPFSCRGGLTRSRAYINKNDAIVPSCAWRHGGYLAGIECVTAGIDGRYRASGRPVSKRDIASLQGVKYSKWLRTSGITAGIPVAAPLHHMDERLMHPEDRGTRWRRAMQAV